MDRHKFIVSYGLAVAFLSLVGFAVSGAPTSLIGAVMGLAISAAARPSFEWKHGLTVASVLTVALLIQSLARLARASTAAPPPDFGQMFFATLAAMSLTALLVLMVSGPLKK